jgi:predicted DNA-binding protein (UPF0251 family)/DNA-directed RNA polymerase subunit RPC12/RpoP
MGRPHKFRNIKNFDLLSRIFEPVGIDINQLGKVFLTMEELEALRLRHYKNLKQTPAAEIMEISQTTFSRIITKAYEKLTKALIEGKSITIQPNYNLEQNRRRTGRFNGKAVNSKIRKNLNSIPLKNINKKVIFYGRGCLNCGFEWDLFNNMDLEVKISSKKDKEIKCPECGTLKTYKLIKKGPE